MSYPAPEKKTKRLQPKPSMRRLTRVQPKENFEPSVEEFHSKQWKTYQDLQKKVDHALELLKHDMERGAPKEEILEHKNRLLLLLGECNYMTREYMKIQFENKKAS